jgi:hypothetical protein
LAGYGLRALVDPLLHTPAVTAGHTQLREGAIGLADGANRTSSLNRRDSPGAKNQQRLRSVGRRR